MVSSTTATPAKRLLELADAACKRNKLPLPIDEVVIRPMRVEDIDEVNSICLAGALEFCSGEDQRAATESFHSARAEKSFKQIQRDALASYPQYNRITWVAVKNLKIIGSVGLKPRARKRLDDHSCVELHKMCVIPAYRGSGLAQKLVRHVEAYCRKQEIATIHLITQDNLTAAVRFYEKEGFQKTFEKKWEALRLLYYNKTL